MKSTRAKTSRSIIEDFYGSPGMPRGMQNSQTDLLDIRNLMDDPTVSNSILTTVNAIMRSGYRFINSSRSEDKKVADLFSKMRFGNILRNVLINLKLYGNAFVEVVKDRNTGLVKELYLLETTEMTIQTDSEGHGDIVGYFQEHQGKEIFFSPDEIWHIALDHVTTSLWGNVNSKAILQTVKTKHIIEDYIWYLFKTNAFSKAKVIKNANDKQVKSLIEGIKARKSNPLLELVVDGDLSSVSFYEVTDLPVLTNYLDYLDSQIRQLLMVPPIVGGQQESANRSTAETQFVGVFGTNLRSLQLLVQDDVSLDLLPKCGFEDVSLRFNPVDQINEREAIQNAVYLSGLGIDPESVIEYLRVKGVSLPEEAEIVPQVPTGYVGHEAQNVKSVSRMPQNDNIISRQTRKEIPNSQNVRAKSEKVITSKFYVENGGEIKDAI